MKGPEASTGVVVLKYGVDFVDVRIMDFVEDAMLTVYLPPSSRAT